MMDIVFTDNGSGWYDVRLVEYRDDFQMHTLKFIGKIRLNKSEVENINIENHLQHIEVAFEDFDEYIDAIAEHITKRKDKKKKYQEYYTIDLIEEDIKQINYDVQVLEHYLFDVTSNEHIYNSFEIQVFTSTIDKIKELVDNNKIDGAKYKLVALQMYFGLNVHFVDTMQKIIFKNIELEDILFGNFLRNNNLDSPRRRH